MYVIVLAAAPFHIVRPNGYDSDIGTFNQFYGLAIGFVKVADGYGAGHVSGGVFSDPMYCVYDVVLAAVLFRIVRPDDYDHDVTEYTLATKLVSEFTLNLFYGIAIGSVKVAGSYGAGRVSGGVFWDPMYERMGDNLFKTSEDM